MVPPKEYFYYLKKAFKKAFAEGVIIENYMDLAKKIRMALRNED